MRKYLSYIIGLFIVLTGLLLKTTLNHNIDYWGTTKTTSIILFAIGFAILIPFNLTKNSKGPINRNLLQALFLAIMLFLIIGLEKTGEKLNYDLRNYYLSKNTELTTGYIKGIKTIDIVKTGFEDFYMIDFKPQKEMISFGLPVKYADKDNVHFDKLDKLNLNAKEITIDRLEGRQINIIYSKVFPSFFRIKE